MDMEVVDSTKRWYVEMSTPLKSHKYYMREVIMPKESDGKAEINWYMVIKGRHRHKPKIIKDESLCDTLEEKFRALFDSIPFTQERGKKSWRN